MSAEFFALAKDDRWSAPDTWRSAIYDAGRWKDCRKNQIKIWAKAARSAIKYQRSGVNRGATKGIAAQVQRMFTYSSQIPNVSPRTARNRKTKPLWPLWLSLPSVLFAQIQEGLEKAREFHREKKFGGGATANCL